MIDLGNYQLGQSIPLTVVTRNGLGRSARPDVIPTVTVYAPTGAVVKASNPYPGDPVGSPNVFTLPLYVDASFGSGKFLAVFRYSVVGVKFLELATFTVVGGGDSGGNVIAMYSLDRPEARYVLGQLSGGSLVQGRNPHF